MIKITKEDFNLEEEFKKIHSKKNGAYSFFLGTVRQDINDNIDGIFLFCKLTVPLMKKQKSGSIIITSSTAGIFGFSHRSPYVTSKWGVIGLMKSLAIELGSYTVKVNTICPESVRVRD